MGTAMLGYALLRSIPSSFGIVCKNTFRWNLQNRDDRSMTPTCRYDPHQKPYCLGVVFFWTVWIRCNFVVCGQNSEKRRVRGELVCAKEKVIWCNRPTSPCPSLFASIFAFILGSLTKYKWKGQTYGSEFRTNRSLASQCWIQCPGGCIGSKARRIKDKKGRQGVRD